MERLLAAQLLEHLVLDGAAAAERLEQLVGRGLVAATTEQLKGLEPFTELVDEEAFLFLRLHLHGHDAALDQAFDGLGGLRRVVDRHSRNLELIEGPVWRIGRDADTK